MKWPSDVEQRRQRRVAALSATDEQIRAALPDAEINAVLSDPSVPLGRLAETVMTGYADRPALAERATERVVDPATGRTSRQRLPRFDTISYREMWARAGAIAADWRQHAEYSLRPGDAVGTLGFTSSDYTIVDLACLRAGAVAVPLQSSGAAVGLRPLVAEIEPRIIACGIDHLGTAVEAAGDAASLRRIVVFDYDAEIDDEREKFEAASKILADAGSVVVLESLATVTDRGRTLSPVPMFDWNPDQLALIVYTSGSTGTPKGAMYPARLVRNLWYGWFLDDAAVPSIVLSYMPMSHVAGRSMLLRSLSHGGTVYFAASSDLSTLFEDIELARPTDLLLVPRIIDTLYERHHSTRITDDLRATFLGGRVLRAAVGAAPQSAEVKAFIESCLDLPLLDSFGSTEAGSITANGRICRPPVLDYKLDDVPDLGYFSTDTPHPRGELLVRTDMIIPGYYRRPELTAEFFDEDGYYRTGDVMAEVGPDQLRYLDRRTNVLKLSQGEFVAVSRLETMFAAHPLIRQIYLYGNSERSHLLAVIVPSEDAPAAELRSALSEALHRTAGEAGLNSYEIPRDFLVETEPFSTANGLLSDLRKPMRPRLRERYGARLEQLYGELAERESRELQALRHAGSRQPVLPAVLRAARAVLGQAADPGSPFTDLGGDSLSALTFATLLREVFEVDVPVSLVISPTTTVGQLAEHIETALRSGTERPTFTTVHGPSRPRAADLELVKFIEPATLAAAASLPSPSGPIRTVLLTGANGFLGRFLCLEWLDRLAPLGGRLICLVRGQDVSAARQRLTTAFDSGDPQLLHDFHELATDCLEVLAGDVGEPRLGLDEPTWQRLAADVDLIVHPAALVNHVLPYQQLFGPNVVGTAEVIRLALTTRLKPVTFLSTVAVIDGQPAAADEDADIRAACPVRELDDGYASGYAASKWAGEVLLREAHETVGLPVAVFRSDMILAHSRYRGQVNAPDMFTRLVLSLLATGIAPRSFYRSDAGTAHYDGLPADFTAEAVTSIGERSTRGYHTFNALNPHDDGISLDVFVDWLIAAGHPITRIDDYDTWFARFEGALRALPEQQRQHSVLPLLHAFAAPTEPVTGAGAPVNRFRAAVRAANVGPGKDIPHVSAALIRKCADDLRHLNLA